MVPHRLRSVGVASGTAAHATPRAGLVQRFPSVLDLIIRGVVIGRRDLLPVPVHLFRIAGRGGSHAAVAELGRAETTPRLPAPPRPDGHDCEESHDDHENGHIETGHSRPPERTPAPLVPPFGPVVAMSPRGVILSRVDGE